MQNQYALQSLKLFKQLYSMTRVLNSWQLTRIWQTCQDGPPTWTETQLVGCYWAPEFLPNLLDFLCWFTRIVAPINAVPSQNQRYMIKEISKWCKTALLTTQCINRKCCIHLLHINSHKATEYFPYTTVWIFTFFSPYTTVIGTSR